MKFSSGTPIRIVRFLLPVLAVVALVALDARAQVPHDTKGRKFWITFMLNEGNEPPSDLRIYMAGEVPTVARLIYHLTNDTIVVPLLVPRTTVEVKINDVFGKAVELDNFEEFSEKSIEVLANDDITLYGININSKSADAFLGLPDDVLTGRYIVLGYPNGPKDNIGVGPKRYAPSEFAIVGTEDGTTVKITAPQGTVINNRLTTSFTIGLDKGQVFFGEAQTIGAQDISGTEVIANKPVAVFGGNDRTSIPSRIGNFRDHLVEQMPPLEAWGKEAVLTPFYKITPSSPHIAEARILAAFDNTVWRIDGVQQTPPLMRGKPVRIDLTKAQVITADQPILVAQYEHSVDVYSDTSDSTSEPLLGDPFMTLIPPSEQFDTAYAFQSVTHEEFEDTAHFINVVVPTTATSTVTIDGVNGGWPFTPVPGSRFSFAQIRVRPGAHYIRASEPFGLYAYGYGAANSYGYNGGMLFRTLVNDFEPPVITADSKCDSLIGVAFDAHITDTGVDSLYITGAPQNLSVSIDPLTSPKDSVHFRARLVDPYQDGMVALKAIDSGGRSFTRVVGVPGFTVRGQGMSGNAPLMVDTILFFNGNSICQKFTLENYGRFQQVISGLDIVPDAPVGTVINAALPITLEPGEKKTIEICFAPVGDTALSRQITIHGDCTDRTIAEVPLASAVDTIPPLVTKPDQPCAEDYVLTIYDKSRYGRPTVTIDTIINGDVIPSGNPDKLQLRWHDRHRDLIYKVTVVDRAGNVTVAQDTLAGFTVAALDQIGDTISVSRNLGWTGDSLDLGTARCDSVTLTNFGRRPIRIAMATLLGNVGLSVPPTQFPIDIAPGEKKKIELCLARANVSMLNDTLLITDVCGAAELVPLSTPIRSVDVLGMDNCRSILHVSMFAPTKRTFMTTPVPNPVAGTSASVDVGLVNAQVVSIELRDAKGEHAIDVIRNVQLDAGISRIEFDLSSVKSGAYFCTMTTAAGERVVEKMIVRH